MKRLSILLINILIFASISYAYGVVERKVSVAERATIENIAISYLHKFDSLSYDEQKEYYYNGKVIVHLKNWREVYDQGYEDELADTYEAEPIDIDQYTKTRLFMEKRFGAILDIEIIKVSFFPMPFEGSEENVYAIKLNVFYDKINTKEGIYFKKIDDDYYITAYLIEFEFL
jgi:molybdopterin converting factor small subunit